MSCARRIPADEAYCTTSVSGIEWTRLPDVPVIVRVLVPVRAGLFTRMVKADELGPVTMDGFQDAEVRAGKPLTLRETVPAKPESAETVTVDDPLPPRGICSVVGETESAKSPVELTVNVTLTE